MTIKSPVAAYNVIAAAIRSQQAQTMSSPKVVGIYRARVNGRQLIFKVVRRVAGRRSPPAAPAREQIQRSRKSLGLSLTHRHR